MTRCLAAATCVPVDMNRKEDERGRKERERDGADREEPGKVSQPTNQPQLVFPTLRHTAGKSTLGLELCQGQLLNTAVELMLPFTKDSMFTGWAKRWSPGCVIAAGRGPGRSGKQEQ